MMKCNHNPDFSTQNTKLLGMKSFNMPAIKTCPGRTMLCTASCYATKGRYMLANIKQLQMRNLLASRCSCFIARMLEKITYADKVIRLHDSGDFYDNDYYQKWLEIARQRPWVTFYTYTKNWSLDLELVPTNFIVYYSIDDTTERFNCTANRIAQVVPGDKKELKHKQKYKEGIICNSSNCASCGYCFREAEDVYFIQKYKKYNVELKII